jgi:hypothetical protein
MPSNIVAAGDITHFNTTNASADASLKDFYLIGLWSYCEGVRIDGVEEITYCSSPRVSFWFDPIDVWGLKDTYLQHVLGAKLETGLRLYRKIMGWMSFAFVFATLLTAAEFVLSRLAIHSRWAILTIWALCIVGNPAPSCLTRRTDRFKASAIFAIVAATTATVAYGMLNGIFHTALGPHMITTSIGKKALLISWLGVATRLVSIPSWLLVFCCC